jgi:subtilase family serine protease
MRSLLIRSSFSALAAALFVGAAAASDGASQAGAAGWAVPQGVELLPVLQRATDAGPADPNQALAICVDLPFARPQEMQAFVNSVNDPKSPNYRHFKSPEEIGEQFGLPTSRLEAVADHLRQYGFTNVNIAKHRLTVMANGTVAQAEQAFQTTIRNYTVDPENAYEPSNFFAPSTAIRMPADIASSVYDVWGLENHTRPHPLTTLLNPNLARGCYNSAPIYAMGTGFQGEGRVVGVSNFDGFRSSNWPLYIAHFGLPAAPGGAGSNVVVVPCQGGGAGAGTPGGEGDLDIQQELGIAPLATIRVYDSPPGGNLTAVLSQEANDNASDAISESYGWNLTAGQAGGPHNLHLTMSGEGITYMAASGDNGTSLDPFGYPDFEPESLSIGGTVANVNNVTGVRVSEVNWTGGGGGWSTNTASFNVRPSWQVGNGVPAVNASNNHKLCPDVAFHSSGSGTGAYQFYFNNALNSSFIGTSFASPMFAGQLQLISLKTISLGGLAPDAHGHRRFGRIADLIYSQNGTPTIWFDIMSGGSNGTLPGGQGSSTPHAGWDTCVGWGPMDCTAFATAVVCNTGGCTGPFTAFCFGDGQDPLVTTLCPCFNFGATNHGCANSVNASGAVLSATGTTSPDTVTLTSAGELNSSLSIFLQGDANTNSGILFGDGVRCASGQLKRLYTYNAVGGTVSAPAAFDPPITTQSANLGAPIPPGSKRYYQTYYRDPNLGFCSGMGFNVTNGMQVQW